MLSIARRRGLSLVEAIIAIFILTFGFAVMARLFHAALSYEANTDARQLASLIAEAKMEEVRAWSWQVHRPGTATLSSDWSAYPGAPTFSPDPNNPEFMVGVNSTILVLYDPCSHFEVLYNAASTNPNFGQANYAPNAITQSAQWVRVTVQWANRSYYLESMMTAPPAAVGSTFNLGLSPSSPANLAQGTTGPTFTPPITDSAGLPVSDVTFLWNLEGEGDATMAPTRSGNQAYMLDELFDSNGASMGYGTGVATMEYNARVRGVDCYQQTSQFIVQ